MTAEEDLAATDSPAHALTAYFCGWRRERRKERLPAGAPARTSAVMTMVQNEPLFLPLWLRYYSQFFAPEDIHVLDHDTTDGSTDRDGFVRLPVSNRSFDNRWMGRQVRTLQRRLLERYDSVLFVDCDEIIAPNPALGDLGEYLARFDGSWITCLGYEVLQMPGEEPLRFDEPILAQRGHWFASSLYDKPALSTVPLDWKPGFHGLKGNHTRYDPDLRMIHLHRADRAEALARHRKWSARRWRRRDLREGWGTHNRIVDEQAFEHWYRTQTGGPGPAMNLEPIPDSWRTVV